LLLAAAEAFALGGTSVGLGAVVERAGTGRNTFYEYFDDVEHALSAVRARVVARLAAALAAALSTARTPVERLRVVSRAFIESLSQDPYEAAVGLWRERETDALSPIGRTLSASYANAMRSTRALSADDELRVLSVSAAAEAIFSECVLDPLLTRARADESGSELRDASNEGGVGRERTTATTRASSSATNRGQGSESKAPVDVLVDLAVRVLR
jgi:AcrR family transcriptional regulator